MSTPDRSPTRLVLRGPDGQELVYALEHGRTVTLGRDSGNTFVLPSKFVSKRHALVSWTPQGVRIEDQGSENGITVNGLTVHAAQLSSGDVIQIGDQRLMFEGEGPDWDAPTAHHVPRVATRKGPRLALVAMVAMGGLLAVAYLFVLAPAAELAPGDSASVAQPTRPADSKVTPVTADRDLQLRSLESAATRAEDEMRFDEAAQQWEQVQTLTLETEPLHARAGREARRLRQRASQ